MTRVDIPASPGETLPPQARPNGQQLPGPPLYVWPIVAMIALLPILITLIVLLVT